MQNFNYFDKRSTAAYCSALAVCVSLIGCGVVLAAPSDTGASNTSRNKGAEVKTLSAQFEEMRREKVKKLGLQGVALANKKNWRGVIATANQVLELEPNNVTWLSMRGSAYWELHRREPAMADYATCLRLHPTAELYETRAWYYQAMGEYTAGLNDIREAIRRKPKVRFFLKEARLLMEHGDYEGAISETKKALTFLKTEPVKTRLELETLCYDTLGLAYLSKKDNRAALEALSKALELIPGWTAACKKNDKSKMIEVAKSDGNRVLRRGEAYEKTGQLNEAISDYELAVAAYPKSFPFRRSLLRAYRRVGQNEKALALVNQLLLEDDAPDLYYKRAEIYKKLGKEAQAKVDLDRARKSEFNLMGSNKNLAE